METIKRRPQVAVDLIECAEYLAADSFDTALRFLDAAESTFKFVAKNPEIGAKCKFDTPLVQQIRFWPLENFEKHLMFYQPITGGIEVVRVLHGARDLKALFSS